MSQDETPYLMYLLKILSLHILVNAGRINPSPAQTSLLYESNVLGLAKKIYEEQGE